MTPGDGTFMDWAFLYTSFEGRIGRQSFWIAVVVLAVIEFAAHFAAVQMQGDRLSAIVDLGLRLSGIRGLGEARA